MSNTSGTIFRVTTFGESHGRAMGAVVDGCPAGIRLNEKDVKNYIKKNSCFFSFSTARREENDIEILSGVYKDKTLGTPISIITYNAAADSSKYLKLEGIARPSHAEYAYYKKYGIYDPRGGGRASGRECVSRHMAAAVADKILSYTAVKFSAELTELAGVRIRAKKDLALAVKAAVKAGAEKDSTGGVFEITITGVPAGLGAPVFDKLSSAIAAAVFSVGGVRAVEIGAGMRIARMKGSEANDCMRYETDGSAGFGENNGGGISGGISTGAPIVVRAYVKPTPSIYKKQTTVDFYKEKNCELELEGRFDSNFTPRAMSAAVSTLKITLVDHLLQTPFLKIN